MTQKVQRLRHRATGQLIPARNCWLKHPDYQLVLADPGQEWMPDKEFLAQLSPGTATGEPPVTLTLPTLGEVARRGRKSKQAVVLSEPAPEQTLLDLFNGQNN